MPYLKKWSLVISTAALLAACGGSESELASVPAAVAQALQSTASTAVNAALCTDTALATGAYRWVDGQCTLASALLSASAATAPATKAQASAVGTTATATSTATGSIDATAFLDWAEGQYPSLFPGRKANLTTGAFVFRYYPETQIALGVSDGKVYGIGPVVGNLLAFLGNLTDFTCQVSPSLCAAPGAPTIGTATAGNGSASIAFTAPTASSSLAVTAYTATCTAGATSKTASGTASPIVVTGLTNGSAYSCSVTATNASGTGSASSTVLVTPTAGTSPPSSTGTTAGVECGYNYSAVNTSTLGSLTSTASWVCSGTARVLSANGIPDHTVGTFPNSNNPNSITVQSVAASYTLAPTYSGTTTALGGAAGTLGYVLNGVKIDAGTAGTCPANATTTSSCSLIGNSGSWSIEALTQTVFKFGTDTNNAHVQPGGLYHYHGMPEGFITLRGGGPSKMTLIGWAADGFPIYARYGYSVASSASSALKVMTGSYKLKTSISATRPTTSVAPLGTFAEDWEYVAGSGDLDECNGRTGVTPEFPGGTYHYYATDSYPFLQRCVKGTVTTTGGGMPPPPRG